MKILLAEDELDLREVVTAYLEYQGYHVTAVTNGAQAVEKAAADAYDAIVMDIMMPVMDGIAAMRAIRAAGNTVPAIFLTAKSQVADRVEGLDAGADDYLTKPFAMEELHARLRALYRRKREYKVRTLSFGNLELDTEASELRATFGNYPWWNPMGTRWLHLPKSLLRTCISTLPTSRCGTLVTSSLP